MIWRQRHVVRPGDDPRGARPRHAGRNEHNIPDIRQTGLAVAEDKRDDAAGRRDDLLHRGIGAERFVGVAGRRQHAAVGSTLAGGAAGACPRICSTRSSWPPRNSAAGGAPPADRGVPCSIVGAAKATEDGDPGVLCGAGWPEPPVINRNAITAATSTTAVAPASGRQTPQGHDRDRGPR